MSVVKKFLKSSVGQLDPFYYLRYYPHSVAPCHNLHADATHLEDSDDIIETAAEQFRKSVKFSYPIPLSRPDDLTLEEINGNDPLLKLVIAKKTFNAEKTNIMKNCDPSMIPSTSESKGWTKVHKNFANLVNWLATDPDPDFNEFYNWYYTGGNIKTTTIKGERYLLKPAKNDLTLGISKLSGRNFNVDEMKNMEERAIRVKGDGNIFQVDALENFILVRKKKNCNFIVLDDELEATRTSFKRSDSFLSCALKSKDEFATLSPDREISIYNPQRGNIVTGSITCEGVNVKDSCGQIYYSGENQIVFLDRSTVYLIDPRTHIYGRGTLKFEIHDVAELCEEVFCGLESPFGLHYISTSHQLLGLDPRQGWYQRWTHGLSPSPCFIASDHQNLCDMMVVGCQRSDNIAYFENRNQKGTFSSLQPYWIPSLSETLNKARCEDLYLSPHLNPRFNFSLTGLCCYVENGLNILRRTSSGDVFWQKKLDLDASDDFKPTDIEVMTFWENECEKLHRTRPKKFYATQIQDTGWIFKDMEETKLPEDVKDMPEVADTWQMSKKTVFSCKDVMAKKILPIWDLEDEEEWSSKEEMIEDIVSSDDDMDASERVRRWFENYCGDVKPEVVLEEVDNLSIEKVEQKLED